jgi:hypothetical protein
LSGSHRRRNGQVVWKAPPGAAFKDARVVPETSPGLKFLISLLRPFTPEEML